MDQIVGGSIVSRSAVNIDVTSLCGLGKVFRMSTTSSALVNASKYARSRTSSPLREERGADVQEAEAGRHSARCQSAGRCGASTPLPTVSAWMFRPESISDCVTKSDVVPTALRCSLNSAMYWSGTRVSSQAKCSRLMPPGASATRGGYSWRITTSGVWHRGGALEERRRLGVTGKILQARRSHRALGGVDRDRTPGMRSNSRARRRLIRARL